MDAASCSRTQPRAGASSKIKMFWRFTSSRRERRDTLRVCSNFIVQRKISSPMKRLIGAFAKLTNASKIEFVRKICVYCVDGKLVEDMIAFMEDRKDAFEGWTDGQEHTLKQSEIHREYCDTFESRIENYIRKSGYLPKDFFTYLKIASEDDRSGAFAAQLDVFLSSFEFEIFVDLCSSSEKRTYWRKILRGWARELRSEEKWAFK